jgi:dolichyl-phosphate beta-glucosyltransferase
VGGLPSRRWSVIIPAYNEAARLPSYLKEVQAYFEGRDESYEVIVVDDGSQDGTADRVREVAAGRTAVTVHALDRNRGKGHAVRAGMARAAGELRLMADADGATPSRTLGDSPGPPASQALRPRVQLPRATPRGPLGGGHPVRLQALPRGVAQALFQQVTTDGFGFDVELLMLAERRGFRVVEVPVNWADQPGSKVGVLREGPRMIYEVLTARRRLARRGTGGRSA